MGRIDCMGGKKILPNGFLMKKEKKGEFRWFVT